MPLRLFLGFPGGTSGKEPACQCRRHKSVPLRVSPSRALARPDGLPASPGQRAADFLAVTLSSLQCQCSKSLLPCFYFKTLSLLFLGPLISHIDFRTSFSTSERKKKKLLKYWLEWHWIYRYNLRRSWCLHNIESWEHSIFVYLGM